MDGAKIIVAAFLSLLGVLLVCPWILANPYRKLAKISTHRTAHADTTASNFDFPTQSTFR